MKNFIFYNCLGLNNDKTDGFTIFPKTTVSIKTGFKKVLRRLHVKILSLYQCS